MSPSEKGSGSMRFMPCVLTDKTLADLENEGWEGAWSFHARFADQWNDACDKVAILQKEGWIVVLVNGQNETERKDGVAYLYKKRRS